MREGTGWALWERSHAGRPGPVVVVFLLLGRQIVSGIMAGAVKG